MLHRLFWLLVLAGMLSACDRSDRPVELEVLYSTAEKSVIKAGLDYWNKLLAERSQGTIALISRQQDDLDPELRLDIFGSETASDTITHVTFGYLADRYAPEMGVLEAPYFFRNKLQYSRLLRSNWFAGQHAVLRQNGVVILGSWMLGWEAQMIRKDILRIDDAAHLNFLVPATQSDISAARSLNYSPIPSSHELYSVVAHNKHLLGVSGPIWYLYDHNLITPESRIIIDNSSQRIENILISRESFEKLSRQQQQILKQTCQEAGYYTAGLATMLSDDLTTTLRKQGVRVIFIDPRLRREYEQLARRYFSDPELIRNWRPGLRDLVLSIIDPENHPPGKKLDVRVIR